MASFVVILTYTTTDMDAVDALLADHLAWLQIGRAEGRFVGWGRKVPRDGGIMLARGASREEVAEIAATDPFVKGGVARVEVIEWTPTFLEESIAGLAE